MALLLSSAMLVSSVTPGTLTYAQEYVEEREETAMDDLSAEAAEDIRFSEIMYDGTSSEISEEDELQEYELPEDELVAEEQFSEEATAEEEYTDWNDLVEETDEISGFLAEDAAYTIDEVKAMIAELSEDPTEYTLADREKIEQINTAFASLSEDDQAVLDTETPDGTQPYGRILETAYWGVLACEEVDNTTTLKDGIYDASTVPALGSTYSKGKSTSSRQKPWSIKSVTVENGKATAVIAVQSSSYTKIWTQGKYFDKTNTSGNSEFAGVPIDLNGTLYLAGVSSSMPRPIAFSITNEIAEPVIEITDLAVTNNLGMFKVVSAWLETMDGAVSLVFVLSGSGYHDLFRGTYEEAAANGANTDNWIHGALNADGKWEFRIPVTAEDNVIPVVAISNSYYNKYLDGKNPVDRAFYPRKLTLDAEAKTLVADDYFFSKDIAVTNNVKMFKVSGATLDTSGGPNSNGYKTDLVLIMGSTSFDKAYVGNEEEAGAATETVALDENNAFALKARWIVTPGEPESTQSWIGEPTVVSFHSVKNQSWYERELTIDEEAGTLVISEYSSKAKAVEIILNNLSETSGLGDKETVEAARAAYEALTDAQKALVSEEAKENLDKAEASVKAAEENKAAADAVSEQLSALKADADLEDKGAVEAARAAYDALKEEQKALVSEEAKANLEKAEASVKAAEEKKAAEEAAAAQAAAQQAAAQQAAAQQPALPAAGTVLTDGKASYMVEVPGSTVAYQGPVSKKVKSATVPETLTIDGITYNVTSIADNAFKNCKKLKKVTIKAQIVSIGANAFAGTKKLKKVTIKSTQLTSIGKKAFSKAGSSNYAKLKVKVPASSLKAYKKLLKKAKLSKKAKVSK